MNENAGTPRNVLKVPDTPVFSRAGARQPLRQINSWRDTGDVRQVAFPWRLKGVDRTCWQGRYAQSVIGLIASGYAENSGDGQSRTPLHLSP